MKPITPNFKTAEEDYCKEEKNKLAQNGYVGDLFNAYRDMSIDEVVWEAEQISKSHGIYLEFDRATSGKEKDWMYMVRITVPGGGPFTREQWRVFDEVSDKYTVDPDGRPSLRLTTRQNVQFHWIKKEQMVPFISEVSKSGYSTINGCGDNVRNVMGCPFSRYSDLFDANELAQELGAYFQLPLEPHLKIFSIDPDYLRQPGEKDRYEYTPSLLNRKFKIAFSSVHKDEETGEYIYDNGVELGTHDLGVAPLVEKDEVKRFQLYIGGGQGQKNGKPSLAVLGHPLAIVSRENLKAAMGAIVKIHEEWGDRQNRVWARLKYVVHVNGIEWYQERLKEKGIEFDLPDNDFDYGARDLHHGWKKQPKNGLWSFGAFVENGRLIDGGPNGDLKKMVRHLMDTFDIELMITPNQDLLFGNITEEDKPAFQAALDKFSFGKRNGKEFSILRKLSLACVGLNTCRLAYTESERYLPVLLDELDARGFGDMFESIGVSGCERQCSRPATKTIGLVGGGKNLYKLKLMGAEDARFQGDQLEDEELAYLTTVPRDAIADLCEVLFNHYKAKKQDGETLGYFHRRIGAKAIIEHLKANEVTAPLMEKVRKL